MSSVDADWKPLIVGFCCNWCSYAGADLAGIGRIPSESGLSGFPARTGESLRH